MHDGLMNGRSRLVDAVKKHKKYFADEDDDEDDDDNSIGTAAAMQALKMFSSGQLHAPAEQPKKSESAFLAVAMSEASKVW